MFRWMSFFALTFKSMAYHFVRHTDAQLLSVKLKGGATVPGEGKTRERGNVQHKSYVIKGDRKVYLENTATGMAAVQWVINKSLTQQGFVQRYHCGKYGQIYGNQVQQRQEKPEKDRPEPGTSARRGQPDGRTRAGA